MRLNEDGEPINLENMPRPHRRRREKKLMTMDEVNEKFPMQKYKSWVASRAQEGLPTRGGVSSPQDRAESVRNADGTVADLPSKERESTEERPTTSATANVSANQETQETSDQQPRDSTSGTVTGQQEQRSPTSTTTPPPPAATETATEPAADNQAIPKLSTSPHDDDDEDDDEHINAALPPECMGTAGDTCAICIDGLEDDDDVRGLSCGHAFHAGCLDPWLTSRRACCPLCKADYYTPKPRAPAAEPGDGMGSAANASSRDARRADMPTRPQGTWGGIRGRGMVIFPTRFGSSQGDESRAHRTRSRSQPQSPAQQPANNGGRGFFSWGRRRSDAQEQTVSPTTSSRTPTAPGSDPSPPTQSRFAAFRSAFPAFRTPGTATTRENGPVASGAIPETTPSNLEAGVRPQYG